jgi:hypothetical protein
MSIDRLTTMQSASLRNYNSKYQYSSKTHPLMGKNNVLNPHYRKSLSQRVYHFLHSFNEKGIATSC